MINKQIVIEWINSDRERLNAVTLAAELGLKDWCIAAGFIRNLVWDKLHDYNENSALNDIDLIYFDSALNSKEEDTELEYLLRSRSNLPWSVKNQARMHIRNGDQPYECTEDAMRFWTEIETAIGVKLNSKGEMELIAPFGLESLFANTITVNPHRSKLEDFEHRLRSKDWLKRWPKLRVEYPQELR